jgi:hypothetical protein
MPRPLWIAIVLPLLGLPSAALANGLEARAWLRKQGYAEPTQDLVIACHGYGCFRRQNVPVEAGWFTRIRAVLAAGQESPDAERKALREAIRIYTAYVAARIGAKPDTPGSPPSLSGVPGQMDCLDVTANTTSLLVVLEDRHLLAHHNIHQPESRGFFLDGRYPHFTAVITDDQGKSWAVDPWRQAPGQLPDLLPLPVWRQRS